ncbi:MAG: hypothetical protein A2Z43_02875 [Syntrophobacterales bacterium RBG_19FT_COMBO_59_10]|nr:MAG: hypothetical protein A2Z43_02875 [Syntrophobacterales bacterium RBG_19FT_COMBO_59_10]
MWQRPRQPTFYHSFKERYRARFSYAHGGKDSLPYPVDRENYDRSIHFLRETLNAAKIGETYRKRAFERLNAFAGDAER